jgi:ubiquinol-cytochrome c reductase cytochrome b subunit
MLLPFLEQWITGDKREHHLLQRPRNAPNRTATLVAFMTFYGVLWEAGGNDIIATHLNLNLNDITYFNRGAVFIAPVIAFIITRRWCISLQRADRDRLLHGYESGIIMRSPEGGYAEKHQPIPVEEAYYLTARDRDVVAEPPPAVDANGVRNRRSHALARLRARVSHFWYASNIQKPTREELEEAQEHAAHELARHEDGHQHLTSGDYTGSYELDGSAADGHQFDGRHDIAEENLRPRH